MVCNLCPRKCGVDRSIHTGRCSVGENFVVARAAKHFWEEPPISGTKGSGTVFFSGCNLGCVYCQNYEISHGAKGKVISDERLVEIFGELISEGAHNINLVNPTHYALRLADVFEKYSAAVPVIYNSSGYERACVLKSTAFADIYLPDLKYIKSERSEKYSGASDYFDFASESIIEMKRQRPENFYSSDGILLKGMIVRHLVLPKNTNQSIDILHWIKNNLGEDTAVSIMSQYTPCADAKKYSELQRKITSREYEKVLDAAIGLGFTNLFVQEIGSSDEKFIPKFDFTGV